MGSQSHAGRRSEGGFTLVEIMVVVALIGLLAAIAIPSLQKARTTARVKIATSDLRTIAAGIDQLAFDTGRWPGGSDAGGVADPEVWDLGADESGLLVNDGRFPRWNGPYAKAVPADPWGHPYFFDPDYTVDGRARVVAGSFGPNGEGPNVYDEDNILTVLY